MMNVPAAEESQGHVENRLKRAKLAMLLAPLALISGCSGLVSSQSSQSTPPPGQTYTVSGTITPAANGSGASVSLSGATTATATADATGAYTFTGLANGTYAVTPSNSGYGFTPATRNATVNGANVTGVNFTAAVVGQTHSATTSWSASTSVVSGYNVYRGTVSGGPYTKLNSSLVTVTTYKDSTVQSAHTYYYVATAVDTVGNESVFSNEVVAVIP